MSDNEDNDDLYSNNSEEDESEKEDDEPVKNMSTNAKDIDIEEYDEFGDDDEDEDEEDDDEDEDDNEDADYEVKVGGKTPIINDTPPNYESDYDDEDTYDDNYLQKFDSEITKNYISEYHPECLHHNYDEIAQMTIVTRDNHNIIIDAFHKTIPVLTKYEKARILGQRASQIESGAKPLVSVPEHIVEGYLIAELELKQKRIPFIIRRPIPGGGCEYWNIKDLEDISF
jgi:DNA-directed RNA polymerase I, II, and III subunit RPABC2